MKFIFSIQARHIYICDHHKELIQSLRTKRKRKDSEDDSGETDSEHPEVDLYQLQVNTLRRYKKHYKVPVRQGLNKAQLADVSNFSIFQFGYMKVDTFCKYIKVDTLLHTFSCFYSA